VKLTAPKTVRAIDKRVVINPKQAKSLLSEVEAQRIEAAGRTPTGADLDRVAGTNNYGRRVLRRWRATGRGPGRAMTPPAPASGRPHWVSPADEGNTAVLESTVTNS
jgi:hypothetical protein